MLGALSPRDRAHGARVLGSPLLLVDGRIQLLLEPPKPAPELGNLVAHDRPLLLTVSRQGAPG